VEEYFAAKPAEELASELHERLTGYRTKLDQNGQFDRWELSYDRYYGNHFKKAGRRAGSALLSMGNKGELSGFAANHYRNLIKHILTLTVSQKVAFDTRAVNTDLKSIQQARLGNNILDYYVTEKRVGRYLKKAAEHSQVFGKGFVETVWDPGLGKPYSRTIVQGEDGQPVADENGQPATKIVYEGDIDVSAPFPWQVLVDEDEEDWYKCEWVAVACLKNKHTLAARYPHLKEKILAIPSIGESESQTRWFRLQSQSQRDSLSKSMIEVVKFYHKTTEAMPQGRYMLSSHGVVMYDDATPYPKKLPVHRVVPGEIIGSTEGYTDAFDLQGPQDAYNVVMATIFSNLQALGINIVYMPEGSNITKDQMQGLAFIKGPAGAEPRAINLAQVPDVLFKCLEVLERQMETLSGVNSVARGNPENSLDSGVALGLVQSMAVQFASAFQESWAELNSDVGSFILTDLLQKFAQNKRTVALAGKHNKGYMAEFSGNDLENIDRVIVDVGNPLMKTTAGRMQIADKMLDRGLIKNPQQYLAFLSSGTYEPMTEGAENQLMLIRKENEALLEGKPVRAMVGDAHLLHGQEHRSVLSDPAIRTAAINGDQLAIQIIQNTMNHIMEHEGLAQGQNPYWAAIAGEPPMPPPPMPGGPMPPDAGALPPPPMDPAAPMPEMVPPNPAEPTPGSPGLNSPQGPAAQPGPIPGGPGF
jgi:hypothetical protein